jgi:transposase
MSHRCRRRSGKTGRGNPWLRTALTEAALGAIRHGRGALAARYRRIMRHRGHKKAGIAVAHAMLVALYYLLTQHTTYRDLGADYYARRAERAKRRALQTLERQGYRVTIEPAA